MMHEQVAVITMVNLPSDGPPKIDLRAHRTGSGDLQRLVVHAEHLDPDPLGLHPPRRDPALDVVPREERAVERGAEIVPQGVTVEGRSELYEGPMQSEHLVGPRKVR